MMRMLKPLVYIAFLILITTIFPSCTSLETELGSLAGAVFYNDSETRAFGAWIRVYETIDPPVIIAEMPVDDEARFFVTLRQGQYYIAGSMERDGTYSFIQDPITIVQGATTRMFLSLNVPPPYPIM